MRSSYGGGLIPHPYVNTNPLYPSTSSHGFIQRLSLKYRFEINCSASMQISSINVMSLSFKFLPSKISRKFVSRMHSSHILEAAKTKVIARFAGLTVVLILDQVLLI